MKIAFAHFPFSFVVSPRIAITIHTRFRMVEMMTKAGPSDQRKKGNGSRQVIYKRICRLVTSIPCLTGNIATPARL